jgi:FlaG protein
VPERQALEAPRRHGDPSVAAATAGQLRSAYAEFVVDSETHEVVVRIRDNATHEVLHEMPSPEVQALMRSLSDYAQLLARRRAAAQGAQGA